MSYSPHIAAIQLASASRGFDHLFANEISSAKKVFASENDPFHLVGAGCLCFLEASLGLETNKMTEATRLLALAEAGSRSALKAAAKSKTKASAAFPPGLEYEIANADTVVLLGISHALNESYMGYLQCIYAMNSAHGKFSKLYKTVFPNGLDSHTTPPLTPFSWTPSTSSSNLSLQPPTSSTISKTPPIRPPTKQSSSSFFGLASRWASGSSSSVSSSSSSSSSRLPSTPDGANETGNTEEIQNLKNLIIAGTAFGFGLFNLVFSLLPKRVQSVAGLFGFAHSRRLALEALSVSASYAAEGEVHGVFAGLVLMTYHGVVLLVSGYQADEARILREYENVVSGIEARYPKGALWILNRAKILRMTYDPESAIRVLKSGLEETKKDAEIEHGEGFKQADTLLMFELAWIYLSQRQYAQSAEAFIKLTELNSWSHGTYYFIAAGCHLSLALSNGVSPEEKEKYLNKAQELLDTVPNLVDKRKMGGKDLPTEVLIKKKLIFYKEKQKRRGGDETKFAQCIRISPAEELGIFWNTHSRISPSIAEAHIKEWSALSPPVGIDSPYMSHSNTKSEQSSTLPDLDTPDELALRFLLLGITHRNAPACLRASRELLNAAHALQPSIRVSTWIGGLAMFELAVLDLKEVEVEEKEKENAASLEMSADFKKRWQSALKSARAKLDAAMALAPNSVDLSSRLDSRVAMLRDEISTKAEDIGVSL
ncbi:outer membrane protein Iml2/Tetratricopeptide repeat protein 39 [Lentinula raphanica]|nr:outer membrane protein Iml2/Tetratricopeptide repeat protein 39 [Lentinula raphanica]